MKQFIAKEILTIFKISIGIIIVGIISYFLLDNFRPSFIMNYVYPRMGVADSAYVIMAPNTMTSIIGFTERGQILIRSILKDLIIEYSQKVFYIIICLRYVFLILIWANKNSK